MLIDNISQSISAMSDEQLYERIREIRKARRVSTPIPKGKAAKKTKSPEKMMELMNGLPKEQLAILIAELEAS
jgi:hypothetical protein